MNLNAHLCKNTINSLLHMISSKSILHILLGAVALGASALVFFLENNVMTQHFLASVSIVISLFILKTYQKPY